MIFSDGSTEGRVLPVPHNIIRYDFLLVSIYKLSLILFSAYRLATVCGKKMYVTWLERIRAVVII